MLKKNAINVYSIYTLQCDKWKLMLLFWGYQMGHDFKEEKKKIALKDNWSWWLWALNIFLATFITPHNKLPGNVERAWYIFKAWIKLLLCYHKRILTDDQLWSIEAKSSMQVSFLWSGYKFVTQIHFLSPPTMKGSDDFEKIKKKFKMNNWLVFYNFFSSLYLISAVAAWFVFVARHSHIRTCI